MIKPLSKWILIRAFVLALVVWFLRAAINTSGGDNISGVIKSEQALGFSEGRASSEACAIQPVKSAHLKFSYGNRRGFRNAASKRTALVSQHAVYTIAGELKERIALPFDIQVVFEECGDPDC